MDDIKICVIGAGRWGNNHIRTLFELGALGVVVDPDAQQRNKIKELFPQTVCFDSLENKPLLFYEKDFDPDLNLLSLKNKPSRKIEYEQTLPLTNELKYFIDVIREKKIDKATFDDGLDVVKILEMATNSLTNKTLPISPA